MNNIIYFFLTIAILFSVAKPVHVNPKTSATNTGPVIVEKLPEPEQTPDIEEIPDSFDIINLVPEIFDSHIWLLITVEVSNRTGVSVSFRLNDIQ